MYASYFNLDYLPFELTPDIRQYTAIKQYSDVFSSLKYCLSSGQGFLKVSGDIGLGKTLLCRMLVNSIGQEKVVVFLPSPPSTPEGIRKVVALELGIAQELTENDDNCVREIYLKLISLKAEQKTVVILLDECQGMTVQALESLRLLANLDSHDSRLLQVVIFGSNELDELLLDPRLSAFRQRIVLNCQLKRLTPEEAKAYLLGRVFNAGGRDFALFSDKALDLLVDYAHGNPRVINILANLSLVAAFASRHHQVRAIHVKRALNDAWLQVGRSSSLSHWKKFLKRHSAWPVTTYVLAVLSLILIWNF